MNYLVEIAESIRRAIPPAKLPRGNVDALLLMYAVLALAKGQDVTREDVHNAWVAWMTSQDADHESIRPFTDLPPEVQAEDDPFVRAIHRVAGSGLNSA